MKDKTVVKCIRKGRQDVGDIRASGPQMDQWWHALRCDDINSPPLHPPLARRATFLLGSTK